ncbi:MAG: type II toxin-antitoxin system prevent-host-death family antitoxin [Candidatus Sericytochromatia bacterium]|nr:type II toxin-antitoxin system prevent-host-death family antitoxin [Candidatus Tanganyikabacteria bacterium]
MKRVGIGELKAKLSAFLRLVQAGDIVIVTDRGREIAEIRRPDHLAPGRSVYAKMVAAGRIIPPVEPQDDLSWLREPGLGLRPGSAQEAIDFERSE